uniref:Uncharacterized protein n=1 Tax=Mandrillus leucophaeus TaxID=9568 RepID=A0A2K5XJJ0_MANLE
MNRYLAVLTNPNVTPTAPVQAPAFLFGMPWKLLGLSSPSPLSTLLGSVCVDGIALGWKGLASTDAKNKKQHKRFLLIAHALTVT